MSASNKQPNVPSSSEMKFCSGQIMKVNKIVSKAWKTAGASCGKMKKPMRSTRARKRVGFRGSPGTAEEDTGQFLLRLGSDLECEGSSG